MRMRPFLESDVFGYNPFQRVPVVMFSLCYGRRPWERRWYTLRGLRGKIGPVGFAFHFGPGRYHNGRKWIIYHYDAYERILFLFGMCL